MKEKLYTIPLNDAMDAHDECPFCFIERNVEHDIMDYVLAVSYTHLVAKLEMENGICCSTNIPYGIVKKAVRLIPAISSP